MRPDVGLPTEIGDLLATAGSDSNVRASALRRKPKTSNQYQGCPEFFESDPSGGGWGSLPGDFSEKKKSGVSGAGGMQC